MKNLPLLAFLLWVPAVAQAGTAACTAPEYRQFDFWIGEWEVTTPDGKVAGRNRIERIEDGCGLQENWTGTSGVTGRSVNTWDSGRKQWHQTWVDSSGLMLLLDGGFRDGGMVLFGRHGDQRHRVTWTPRKDGSVTQVWERSKDDGKTWTNVFHGTYRQK